MEYFLYKILYDNEGNYDKIRFVRNHKNLDFLVQEICYKILKKKYHSHISFHYWVTIEDMENGGDPFNHHPEFEINNHDYVKAFHYLHQLTRYHVGQTSKEFQSSHKVIQVIETMESLSDAIFYCKKYVRNIDSLQIQQKYSEFSLFVFPNYEMYRLNDITKRNKLYEISGLTKKITIPYRMDKKDTIKRCFLKKKYIS